MRLHKPRVTGLIFNSGRMVCTGGKLINENKEARIIVESIQKIYEKYVPATSLIKGETFL
jgi:TATA-box binding protein (TBP) (component of TFIID and TFIIIB)